jgi:SAM-dependent methyltransferase
MSVCPVCRIEADERPLCEVTLGGASRFDLVECGECGVRRLRPMATPEQLEAFYSADYYGRDWYKQQGQGMAFAKSFLRGLAPGRFLDVGCGLGFFIDGIRKHSRWEVSGVEFSEKAVEFARRELGLDVRQGELAEVGYPEAHFDYVHVSNVLEHVTDPVGLLRECRRVIRPGGTFHLRVPNGAADSLDLITFHRERGEPALSPSGHLYFFPERTLLRMFDEAGFRVERAYTYGIRRGLSSMGRWPRKKNWQRPYVAAARPVAPEQSEIVLPPKKRRPDIYYHYRFARFRLRMLSGMRPYGLDYLLLLRPKP